MFISQKGDERRVDSVFHRGPSEGDERRVDSVVHRGPSEGDERRVESVFHRIPSERDERRVESVFHRIPSDKGYDIGVDLLFHLRHGTSRDVMTIECELILEGLRGSATSSHGIHAFVFQGVCVFISQNGDE